MNSPEGVQLLRDFCSAHQELGDLKSRRLSLMKQGRDDLRAAKAALKDALISREDNSSEEGGGLYCVRGAEGGVHKTVQVRLRQGAKTPSGKVEDTLRVYLEEPSKAGREWEGVMESAAHLTTPKDVAAEVITRIMSRTICKEDGPSQQGRSLDLRARKKIPEGLDVRPLPEDLAPLLEVIQEATERLKAQKEETADEKKELESRRKQGEAPLLKLLEGEGEGRVHRIRLRGAGEGTADGAAFFLRKKSGLKSKEISYTSVGLQRLARKSSELALESLGLGENDHQGARRAMETREFWEVVLESVEGERKKRTRPEGGPRLALDKIRLPKRTSGGSEAAALVPASGQ